MRSLVAPHFTEPSGYVVQATPTPRPTRPSHVLIRVAAASVNAHDVIMASGKTRLLQALPLPYPIGLDFAGVVEATGADGGGPDGGTVAGVRPSDRVYGFTFAGGAAATHLLLDTAAPHALAAVPPSLAEHAAAAAALPAVGVTALVALRRADAVLPGGLAGKRVFVPAALSGTGAAALQLAKRRWGCTTLSAVSGAKVPLVPQHLGAGTVDELIDYTAQDPVKAFGAASVDFVFDTTGQAVAYMPLVRRGGLVLSIARVPPGSAMESAHVDAESEKAAEGAAKWSVPGRTACIGKNVMDMQDSAVRTWARMRYGIGYEYQKTEPTTADLVELAALVEAGKLKPVVGRTAKLGDLEAIREASMGIFKGKGGLGKFVIEMDEEQESDEKA